MPAHATSPDSLDAIYQRLRSILQPHILQMQVIQDNERGLYLNARTRMRNGQPLFFAAAMITPPEVSFYVFAVELYPELVDAFPLLAEHLQGTHCFTFRTLSDEQFAAMDDLVAASHERLKAEGDL
jgi:hypothetical protein